MLKLNSLLIGSEDPDRLALFYEAVLQTKPGFQEGGFTGFDVDGTYLMVGPHDQVHGKNPNPERLLFNFESPDVQGEFDRIKSVEGAAVVKEPYNPGPSPKMWLATVADPDGNYFQLASPME